MISEAMDPERLRALGPDEAAAHWLVRFDQGIFADELLFEDWLAESDANAKAWERAQTIWDGLSLSGEEELRDTLRTALVPSRRSPRRWQPLAVAAAVIAAISGSLAFEYGLRPPALRPVASADRAPDRLAVFGQPDFQTAKGQRSTVRLPDGTQLVLDTDTAVDIAFTGGRRDVRLLRGRAFFNVAHDRAHPFAVDAAGRIVTALGTRFDMWLRPANVRVQLLEGKVAIAAQGASGPAVELHPGEQYVSGPGLSGRISGADANDALNWQRGVVEFHDETLREAAAEFNRYGGPELIVRDPAIANLRVSGVFRLDDPERFGRAVSQIHEIRVVRTALSRIEIVPVRP